MSVNDHSIPTNLPVHGRILLFSSFIFVFFQSNKIILCADVIQSIRFVRSSIHAFGGDKEQV